MGHDVLLLPDEVRAKLVIACCVINNHGNERLVYYLVTIFLKYWYTSLASFIERPEEILYHTLEVTQLLY